MQIKVTMRFHLTPIRMAKKKKKKKKTKNPTKPMKLRGENPT
jgi:hypothetical protein